MSCWQCGTVLSTAGGRCPACGAEQPPPTPRQTAGEIHATVSRAPIAPSARPGREEEPRTSSALPWLLLVGGLAAIGIGAALFMPKRSESATIPEARRPAPSVAAEAPKNPDDFGPMDMRALDPMELLGKAKTRALAWSKDAVLVSLRAHPVVSGRVDVSSSGSIEYWFGKPTGEGFAPGAKIAGKPLHVTIDQGGVHVDEAAGTSGRVALEPNCPLDAAAHAALATKLPAGPLLASYEVNDRAGRPVWQISPEGSDGPVRLLDGQSCAVLVR
jgi:hypothetical protein